MKSVHLTNYYHKNSGGISTSYNALLAAAGRHQRDVRLIVPGEAETIEIVNDFAKIYYVPAKSSPVFDKRYRVIMPWQYLSGDTLIRKILADEKPDLIEVTDKYTLSLIGAMVRKNKFRSLGRPLLVHFSCERMDDNFRAYLSKGPAGRMLSRLIMGNFILPSFDHHIANSTYTADEFFEAADPTKRSAASQNFMNFCWRFFRAPRISLAERVSVCPRGVNAVQFRPDRKSEAARHEMIGRSGFPENSVILLYAGRLSPEKNVKLLPALMRLLATDKNHDYRLIVAGAGPLDEWLGGEGEKLAPGRIRRLGHLDKELLADYYANADVFVHPNPREPFGIAPLEAMASGVPTVAPNSGGILSYASDENAWLVRPNAEEFADAIRSVMQYPAARRKKIAAALETALANTREASTDRLFATYDRIYEDFLHRRAFYTDNSAAREFDYLELLGSDPRSAGK